MSDLAAKGRKSAELRTARAAVRASLEKGRPLGEVFAEMPACIADLPAWRVLGWVRLMGPAKVAAMNDEAITDGINLARPVASFSERERAWIAKRVLPWSEGRDPRRDHPPVAQRPRRLQLVGATHDDDREGARRLPIGPFREWLEGFMEGRESNKEGAELLGVNESTIRGWRGDNQFISLDHADRCFCLTGDSQLLRELYPDLYEFGDDLGMAA